MRKLTCPPEAEVLGAMSNIFVENLLGDVTAPIFKKYGLMNINLDKWYPLHPILSAFNELAQIPDVTSNMVAIGMKFGEAMPLDDQVRPFETLLMGWDEGYQMHHRGADVGRIWIEKVTHTHFKTFYTIVYPDNFSYGVLYGFAKRFLPKGTNFTVFYDPDVPARDYGGTTDYTVIHLKY
ncbi:MAG: hypothetical protein BroJett018_52340 [Chloroflexota bacterium]|nr:MAG: hypothetical protein BroJett018_52340 [Chloroflexota bacterium]